MQNNLRRFTAHEYMSHRPDRTHLAHYITFRPNMLSSETCDGLVKAFDNNPHLQQERTQGGDHFRFMQTDVSGNSTTEPWKTYHEDALNVLRSAARQYKEDIKFDDTTVIFPPTYGYEKLRINRTMNNGKDGFGNHVDVGDYASAKRFLTMLFYLSDVEVGGDAAFPPLGFSVKPEKGSLLIFPSNFVFMHCGLKPISDPKYIMTSFLHYL